MATTKEANIKQSVEDMKKALTDDIFIIQAIHSYTELETIQNKIKAILRERLGYLAPEGVKEETTLLELAENPQKEDIGMQLSKEELTQIQRLANTLNTIQEAQNKELTYIESLMQNYCPKLQQAATTIIAAKLLNQAGSLKRLASLTSSTIQILGAEKALFRHLKKGNKAPKFGFIFAHPDINMFPKKAKAARQIASRIAMAAREDYFGN